MPSGWVPRALVGAGFRSYLACMSKGNFSKISLVPAGALRSGLMGLAAALGLAAVSACTIEMGPPPESDPPLVAEKERPAPPPAQPEEPQAWSKDLDLDGGELSVRRGELAEGLIADDESRTYSAERLTFESAASGERPPTEAELIRERARKRLLEAQSGQQVAEALAPPEVVAAPVESVRAEALPEPDATAVEAQAPSPAASDEVLPAEQQNDAPDPGEGTTAKEDSEPGPVVTPTSAPPEQPQFASAEPLAKLPEAGPPSEELADLLLESWDAPDGTILVQVSAIQNKEKIADEWERLKAGYPGVLGPLRLVVEEAKLGDRGVFFRVQAGGFDSQGHAEAACAALTDQGQSCFVLKRSIGG